MTLAFAPILADGLSVSVFLTIAVGIIGTMTAGTVALLAGAAAAKAGTDIYGAKKAGDASKRAGEQATASNQAALEFEKEQAALDRADALRAEEENQRRYEEEQKQADLDRRRTAAIYGDESARSARSEESKNRDTAFDQSVYYTREGQRQPYREASLGTLQAALKKRGIAIAPASGFQAAPGWSQGSLAPSSARIAPGTDLASLGN